MATTRAIFERLEVLERAAAKVAAQKGEHVRVEENLNDLRRRFNIIIPHNGRD